MTVWKSGRSVLGSWRELTPERLKILVIVLLFLISVPMLTKIFTSDFGTHIAKGRQIVQTREIPKKEFLNYPRLGMPTDNQEWLFQAVLYLVYSAGGVYGVSLLCWTVVFGVFFFIHRATVLRGGDPLLAVATIFAFSGFLRIRIQPRPEIFTYLFIAITIYIFCEYYFGKRKKVIYLYPLLVLLWANMHPTYLMAFLLCGAFFIDGLLRAAWRREIRWPPLKTWIFPPVVVGVLGMILSGINPSGYEQVFAPLHLISRGGGQSHVLLSISELTPVRGTSMYPFFKAALVFSTVSLVLGAIGRRIYLIDLLLFAIAFKGSWDSARAVSMMGLFLSPGASVQMTGFLERVGEWVSQKPITQRGDPGKRKAKKREPKKRTKEEISIVKEKARPRFLSGKVTATVSLVVFLLAFGGTNLGFTFSQLEFGLGITSHKFSFEAADFLRKNPIPGKMFNFFDVGGFLDWQLYPQALTYIDGRTNSGDLFMEHQLVTGAMLGWDDLLKKRGITYVVTKAMDSSGLVLPLINALNNDPEWVLVFADGLFVVYVRSTPETQELIRKFSIPKTMIARQIIWESYHYMYLGVSPVVAYQNMANMYLLSGDRPAAIRTLREAVEESGGDPYLKERLLQLESGVWPK